MLLKVVIVALLIVAAIFAEITEQTQEGAG